MKKGLQERFARFHASFPLDDVYLGLPRSIRNGAYLYLLALNGHQRAKEADAYVPMEVAQQLALMMRVDCSKALRALEVFVDKDGKKRVVDVSPTHVFLVQYSKWQDTPEQIAELRAARSDAGHKGALAGWERKRSQGDQQDDSKSPASAGQVLQQIPAEIEREVEVEIESLIAPPTHQARPLDAFEDETVVELAKGMYEVFQHALSPLDVTECQAALNQYPYLSVKDLIVRAQEHQDWCRDNKHPMKRTVGGFSDTWRRQNEHVADQPGAQKVVRIVAGRSTGMGRPDFGSLLPKKATA